ncbi:MAG: hypothetical protein QM811_20805 [Pirellulales bacterium]
MASLRSKTSNASFSRPKRSKSPPLLGMSFLGNFKFEIDKNKSELKMVKIDQESKK